MAARRAASVTSPAIPRRRVSLPSKRSLAPTPVPPASQATRVSLGPGGWSMPMSCERWRLRLAMAIWKYERPVSGSMPPVGRWIVAASRSKYVER